MEGAPPTGLDAAKLIAETVFPRALYVPAEATTTSRTPARGTGAAWREASPALRERAVTLAGAARIDLLLATSIRTRAGAEHVPPSLASRAGTAKAHAAFAWVEGAAVIGALERAGHAPVCLKGADLSARAYPAAFADLPDRAYLRHATDLDLLVADPPSAAPAMKDLGFLLDVQGAAHHVRWTKASSGLSFSVELHSDLFDRPHGLTLPPADLRARAILVPAPDGERRRVLSPVDAAMHVGAHAVYSDLLRDPVAALRGPIDLAALALSAKPRGAELLRVASSAGLDGPLSIALWWANHLIAAFPDDLAIVGRAMFLSRGPRFALGRRVVLANARAALEGGPPQRSPATLWRALLAPSVGSAAGMLREGMRRRI